MASINTAWAIYTIALFVVGTVFMGKLTRVQIIIISVLGIVGVMIATCGYFDERAADQLENVLTAKITDPKTGLTALHGQLDASGAQLATFGRELAICLKPGLKKQALELASTLMGRTTEILALAGNHPLKATWPPGSSEAHLRDEQQVEATHEQSRIEGEQLLKDYKSIYVSQVLDLRQDFIQQGQTDWEDTQYYSNPSSVQQIQQIGFALFQHAKLLNWS
jgi:hypothetical protein